MALVWTVVVIVCFFVVLSMIAKWLGGIFGVEGGDIHAFRPLYIKPQDEPDGDFGERWFKTKHKAIAYARRWKEHNRRFDIEHEEIVVKYDSGPYAENYFWETMCPDAAVSGMNYFVYTKMSWLTDEEENVIIKI